MQYLYESSINITLSLLCCIMTIDLSGACYKQYTVMCAYAGMQYGNITLPLCGGRPRYVENDTYTYNTREAFGGESGISRIIAWRHCILRCYYFDCDGTQQFTPYGDCSDLAPNNTAYDYDNGTNCVVPIGS